MDSRRRNSPRAKKKYNHYLPALILTLSVLLLSLLGIGLYDRKAKYRAFYEQVPDVDLANMDTKRKTTLIEELNCQTCTCGCGMTLARCRNVDSQYLISMKLAREVAMQTGGPGLK